MSRFAVNGRSNELPQDFYKTAYMGGIDTLSGFAVIASSRTCFVWQHAQVCSINPLDSPRISRNE